MGAAPGQSSVQEPSIWVGAETGEWPGEPRLGLHPAPCQGLVFWGKKCFPCWFWWLWTQKGGKTAERQV